MRKFIYSVIGFVLFTTVSFGQSYVAVLDLSANGVSSVEAKAITEKIRVELFQMPQFRIVERELMEDIIQEQNFQLSGCTSNECLVEVGKILGVEQVIGGSISQLDETYLVTIRLIDVETAEILNMVSYDSEQGVQTLIAEGTKILAEKLTGVEPKSRVNTESSFEGNGLTQQNSLELVRQNTGLVVSALPSQFQSFDGVMIDSVESASQAARKFIRSGTIILAVDSTRIHNLTEYERAFDQPLQTLPVYVTLKLYNPKRGMYSAATFVLSDR